MLDVKSAAQIAMGHVADLFKDQGGTRELLLEEAELSDDGKLWNITVSFLRPADPSYTLMGARLGGEKLGRVYKTVSLVADTGEVRAVRIRALA
jgi:hypothetical protein